MSDPQEHAETLDEEVINTADDLSGDQYGEGLASYPPDEPLGVDENDVPDSWAERCRREVPEVASGGWFVDSDRVGELVDPAGPEDHEERMIADETDSENIGPEERAMHIERD